MTRIWTIVWLGILCGTATAAPAFAQGVPAAEREALIRLGADRGRSAQDVEALIRLAEEAAAKGLPSAPLTSKIREGLAKGHEPRRVEPVVRRLASDLGTAAELIAELSAGGPPDHAAAVTLLAEALGGGVTPDEVRELQRVNRPAGAPPPAPAGIASAAKGLSFIKDAQLPAADGAAVIGESLRREYRPQEILDLGREIKRRERDYQTGRATLLALRDAIARGERPDQLFRARAETVERPAPRRGTAAERPERPARPEPAERPVRPERPEIPERPVRGR